MNRQGEKHCKALALFALCAAGEYVWFRCKYLCAVWACTTYAATSLDLFDGF